MRSNTLLLLASVASHALALPAADLDTRSPGLISGLIETVTDILEGQSPVNLLHGLGPRAAAALGGGALGCKAGSVDAAYRKELAAWIRADAGVHLDASLKTSLLAWCNGDDSFTLSVDACAGLSVFIPTCASLAAEADLYVNLDGVSSLVDNVVGVLSASAQASLSASLSVIGELDLEIKAALEFCAAGGVVSDLSVEVIAALKAWLSSSECSLSASLKTAVLAWCEGEIGGDVISIGSLPTGGLVTLSVGNAVYVLVEETGILVASAQASLTAFLKTEVGLGIEADIKAILEGCAKGELAISFGAEARTALSAWLASSSCELTAELKAVVVFWLSFAVSASTEVSLGLSTNIITELSSFITGTVDSLIGTHLSGLISLIVSGEGLLSISLEARAQLAALCSGAIDIEIDVSIQIIIIGWLTGCHECCTGGTIPTTTTTSSLPSSTLTVTPTISSTSVPVETITSATVITTTTSVPSVSETSTPCDTITSETVIPTTISTTGGSSPSGPGATETTSTVITTSVPGGSNPSGPGVTETSTPCETITSETVFPTTTSVPGGSNPSGPGATETTSVSGLPTTTTTVPGGSNPPGPGATATTTPCETITSETLIPTTISTSATVPTTSSPPESSSTGPEKTVTVTATVTATVSVPYCPTSN